MERSSQPMSPSLVRGLITLAALVLLVGVAAGYQAGTTPVTLVVDGVPRSLRTRQATVGALLLDVGVPLQPEDIVDPPPDAPLSPGMTVRVVHARLVWIEADGQQWRIRTHATAPEQILQEAGVSLQPYDQVIVEPVDPADNSSALHLVVRRAVPVTLHEDGGTVTFYTTARTVGEALREMGLRLYLADRVQPDLGEPLAAGTHIYVERSRPVTVQVDGRTIRTRTHRERVGEVLSELGIVLSGRDYTRPPLDATLGDETTIEVVRVAEEFVVEQSPIPFDVVWQPDPELEIDHRRVLQEGAPGMLKRRWRVRYENGVEVSRTLENEYVAVPPTTKIIGYGTKIVVRQLETPQGTVEYWRVIRMLATSYSASTAGVPRTSPYYGRTRLGLPMRHGIVAVDPRVVPLGSRVYVPGYGVGLAADTGGAIKGRRIDLGYDDDNLVLWYRWVEVYLLTPVPPPERIDYILEQ
ncbi:MAG TPA: DUF348 domain-containing protein [Thermoflexia bacterium]|nr:DUF348 domain-containing protein [Thermoflexia bacterium]